eukprot:1746868-Pleurochrysis_carterae.AAC.1
MLWVSPPPYASSLSTQSAFTPNRDRKAAIPSGRKKGPEKSSSTQRNNLAAVAVDEARCQGAGRAASAMVSEGGGSPDGDCRPSPCGRHQYSAQLRPWRYERAARQHGACFEASYQRQNELTKQHTKQTAADYSQAENERRELSSLHTKHDVN